MVCGGLNYRATDWRGLLLIAGPPEAVVNNAHVAEQRTLTVMASEVYCKLLLKLITSQ